MHRDLKLHCLPVFVPYSRGMPSSSQKIDRILFDWISASQNSSLNEYWYCLLEFWNNSVVPLATNDSLLYMCCLAFVKMQRNNRSHTSHHDYCKYVYRAYRWRLQDAQDNSNDGLEVVRMMKTCFLDCSSYRHYVLSHAYLNNGHSYMVDNSSCGAYKDNNTGRTRDNWAMSGKPSAMALSTEAARVS